MEARGLADAASEACRALLDRCTEPTAESDGFGGFDAPSDGFDGLGGFDAANDGLDGFDGFDADGDGFAAPSDGRDDGGVPAPAGLDGRNAGLDERDSAPAGFDGRNADSDGRDGDDGFTECGALGLACSAVD